MREFDRLELVIRSNGVHIFVNGVDLIDLVGGEGLGVDLMLAPSMHLMGAPDPDLSEEGKPFLLGCICGVPACGPVLVRIDIEPDTVTWHEFAGFGNEPISNVGPFVFRRPEYEKALRTRQYV